MNSAELKATRAAIDQAIKQMLTGVIATTAREFDSRLEPMPDQFLRIYSADVGLNDDQIRERFREGINAIFIRRVKLKLAERQAKPR